ncbi:serine/threonine protein kinase [Sphaerisporangium corydalis]|uniref:Serine/threonine protein kinase n=1 Tax=Sphaerisporangium corydalis TaxID=1441875 RepID=A0ABV9EU08_9ACTN|nr:hypothetical protein [Sphaerisporangium corydalis]
MRPADSPPADGPAEIGPYRVVRVLSSSCCSVTTYLAETASGERVALRHYADPSLRRPSGLSELERLRDAPAAGTVHVLDVQAGYIVSEYVDGPDLAGEIERQGPLAGAALQRLAISTVTALAALHRSGAAHVGIRPDRVLLGPDGPRLIYRGPERHDMLGPAHETNRVDATVLAWHTPEELAGDRPGQAADLFTWASVIAYAATGRDPFDGESITESTRRLSTAAASLGRLEEGPLRDALADCLAREPDDRPTAEDTLLRLLGHSQVLDTALPDALPPGTAPRRRSAPRRVLVLVAAGVAIALVSSGISAAVTLRAAERPAAPAPATSAPAVAGSWTPRAVPSATTTALPPKVDKGVALPGNLGTLYEHPADPVRLSAIRVSKTHDNGRTDIYARDPRSGTFERAGSTNTVAELSPDGRYLATMDTLYLATSQQLSVQFTDHLTGAKFGIPTLRSPYVSFGMAWSRQSDSIVVSALRREKVGKDTHVYTAGFVIVDVAARSSVFVPTTDAEDVKVAGTAVQPESFISFYRWAPDGRSVAARYLTAEWGNGLRFRDLAGQPLRLMHWVGSPTGNGDWFSPSGDTFVTSGCEKVISLCVWRTTTGERVATIPVSPQGGALIGWYDDRHIIEVHSVTKDLQRVVLRDFAGQEVRVLADLNAPVGGLVDIRYTRG